MKASILINEQIAAQKTAFVPVVSPPVTLFARGLGVGETVALELLAADVDPGAAAAGDWVAVKKGGTAVVLDPDNTVLRIEEPGEYRVVTPAVTAGVIAIGLY